MIVSKPHYADYKKHFENNASRVFDDISSASKYFATVVNVNEEVAKSRIENDTNADWIVCPDGRVFVMNPNF